MKKLVITILIFIWAGSAEAGTPWVSVSGGQSTFGLGEVTDAQTTYRGYSIEQGSMDSGRLFGAAFGVDLSRPWSIGVSYDHSDVSTTGTLEDIRLNISMPLQSIKVVPYWYPVRGEGLRVGIGAGIGLGFVKGSAVADGGMYDGQKGEVGGTDLLLEGRALVEYRPLANLAIQATGGIRDITFEEVVWGYSTISRDDTGDPVSFDYGGWFVQLGLKFLLPNSSVGL